MNTFAIPTPARPLQLRAMTAAELMTTNPVAFRTTTSIREAYSVLQSRRLEAAPIVDEERRLVGTVTRAACSAWMEYSLRAATRPNELPLDDASLLEIATPMVECVTETTPTRQLLARLLAPLTNRVYVVDEDERLVGVVSRGGVLRQLLEQSNRPRVRRAGASQLC